MPSIKDTEAYKVYEALTTRPEWHPAWVKNQVSKNLICDKEQSLINPRLIRTVIVFLKEKSIGHSLIFH